MHDILVFAAACAAGAINAVAGGGTLVTFPTLVWLGVPSISANATNTVALWPGSLGSVWGYRRELRGVDTRVFALVVPSLAGGLAGAILLDLTPTEVFDRLVPFLILFATLLFMAQEPLQRRFNLAGAHVRGSHWLSWSMLFQFGVAVYGGYFGAGQGILMLAALTLMGHTDIHRMNGVKALLATAINGIAAIYFAFYTPVVWRDAAVMAVGGFCGATALLAMLAHLAFERTIWPASPLEWLALAALGLGPVGSAFFFWDHGTKHGDIRALGVAAYSTPLLSTILLVAVGYGRLSWGVAVACILVTGGAALAARDLFVRQPVSQERSPLPGSSPPSPGAPSPESR